MRLKLHAHALSVHNMSRLQTVRLWFQDQGLVQVTHAMLILHKPLLQLLGLVKHNSGVVREASWLLIRALTHRTTLTRVRRSSTVVGPETLRDVFACNRPD